MNKFPSRLKELRLEKEWSRKQLAEVLHVSERLISYWENGQRECSFDMLLQISDVFEISLDFLLGKTEF